ncbi:MAG: hypothetical protein U0Q15_17025 [Kineosporiaceae bacterium]
MVDDASPSAIPRALREFALLALAQAQRGVVSGGPLVPFSMIDTGAQRDLTRFPGDAEAGLDAARSLVRDAPSWQYAAVAWDAPFEGGDTPRAVYVEAAERGFARSVVLAQGYGRRLLHRHGAIGSVTFVGFGAPLP